MKRVVSFLSLKEASMLRRLQSSLRKIVTSNTGSSPLNEPNRESAANETPSVHHGKMHRLSKANQSGREEISEVTRFWTTGLETITVDLVCIGSGPFNLVRAITTLSEGKDVVLVEETEHIGGAWATRACFGEPDLRYDCVAHLLSPFPDAYSMLESSGFKLRPRPVFFWQYGIVDPFHLKFVTDEHFTPVQTPSGALLGWHQWMALQNFEKCEKLAQKTLHNEVATFTGFRYFRGNFQPLVDKLRHKFFSLGGKMVLNKTIEKVAVHENSIVCEAPGMEIRADRVFSGRHMTAAIDIYGESIQEELQYNEYNSLIIRVALKNAPSCSYINCVSHPNIGAIQIARCENDSLEGGTYALTVVSSYPESAEADLVSLELMRDLQSLDVVDDFVILDAVFYRYHSSSHSTAYCKQVVTKSDGRVNLHVVDWMAECMSSNASEWFSALN